MLGEGLLPDLAELREQQSRGLCPRCATEIAPGASECPGCHSARGHVVCFACGASARALERYCGRCFAPLGPRAEALVVAPRILAREGTDIAEAPDEVAAAMVEIDDAADTTDASSTAEPRARVLAAGAAVAVAAEARKPRGDESARTQNDPLRRCTLCGYENASQAEFCGACWGRMPVGSAEAPTRLRMIVDSEIAERWEVHGVRTGFVGRSTELSELSQIFDDVCARRVPRLVTIVGEAGVGKSRLFGQLCVWLREHSSVPRVFSATCRDDETHASLGPVVRILRDRFGVREHDAALDAREKVRRAVREACGGPFGDDAADTFLKLLALSDTTASNEGAASNDASLERAPLAVAEARAIVPSSPGAYRTWGALGRFLESDARSSPMVWCIDDAHHAAPELLSALRHLATHLQDAPVLLVAIARPELYSRRRAALDAAAAQHRIDLDVLSSDESQRLVEGILGSAGFGADFVRETAARGRGNPLFLEELCRVALEQGPKAAASLVPTLPVSVDEAVRRRLSFLTPRARAVLEKAALVGRSFWLGALVALERLEATGLRVDPADRSRHWFGADESEEVRRALEELRGRDFISRNPQATFVDEEEYLFKQGTERDLVYTGVASAQAKAWHRFVSQWLLQRRGGADHARFALAARHRELAGDSKGAARLYLGAADRARRVAEPERCADLYERGLALLPEDEVSTRLAVLHGLGDALVRAGQLDRAIERFQEMLRCAWLLGEKGKGGAAYNRMGRIHRHQGRYDAAMAALSDGHTLFLEARDWRGVASSLDDIGQVHRLRGDYEQAMYHFQEALSLRREIGDPRGIALSLYNVGELQRDAGRLREAATHLEEGLGFIRQTTDLVGISALLSALGALHHERGEGEMAAAYWEEALPLARDAGDRDAQGKILARMGELAIGRGDFSGAVALCDEALELVRALDDRAFLPWLLRTSAEAHLRAGDGERAHELAEEALRLAREVGSRHDEAIAHRVLGEVHALTLFDDTAVRAGAADPAGEHLAAAVEIAEAIGNDLELGRALTSFGNYMLERGELERGRDLLLRAREMLERQEASRSLARAERTIDKLS